MVSIVMVGEGPPSTSYRPGFNKDADADPAFAWGRLCIGMTGAGYSRRNFRVFPSRFGADAPFQI
jgi:hypothetical protein